MPSSPGTSLGAPRSEVAHDKEREPRWQQSRGSRRDLLPESCVSSSYLHQATVFYICRTLTVNTAGPERERAKTEPTAFFEGEAPSSQMAFPHAMCSHHAAELHCTEDSPARLPGRASRERPWSPTNALFATGRWRKDIEMESCWNRVVRRLRLRRGRVPRESEPYQALFGKTCKQWTIDLAAIGLGTGAVDHASHPQRLCDASGAMAKCDFGSFGIF